MYCCKCMLLNLLFDVCLLQTVVLFLVDDNQENREDDSCCSEGTEDAHTCGVCLVYAVDFTNEYRYKAQSDVLDVEDDGVSGAEGLHRDNLWNARPHG